MANLVWNFQGYIFAEGIAALRAAYNKATQALEEELQSLRAEAYAYQQGLESGEVDWIGEREDGYVLWGQEQVYELEIASKQEGLCALRKAFVLAAYHHWERGARGWTKSQKRDHSGLVKAVQKLGIEIHPHLEAVKDLANLLKHNNDKRGSDLVDSWPQVMPRSFQGGVTGVDWYGAVSLTDAHLGQVFQAITSSGPDVKTVFKPISAT